MSAGYYDTPNYNTFAMQVERSGNHNIFKIKANNLDTTVTPLTLTHTGAMTITGSLTQNSDDRIKSNESDITNGLDTILKLRPQLYTKMTDPNSDGITESGLITQEVWYDAPELRHLVSPGPEANITALEGTTITSSDDPQIDPDYSDWGASPSSLNYIGLIPYLISAIQEQNAQLQDLRTRLAALEHA